MVKTNSAKKSQLKKLHTPAVFVIRLPITAKTSVRCAQPAFEKKAVLMQVTLTSYLSN